MLAQILKNESPFGAGNLTKAVVSGSQDYYGACSLQQFSSASSLSQTHADAQGWLDYPTGFQPANFWFKDAGVKVWEYEETYDNWQDTYGADAVLAFYHSGHGNMDSNGVFQAPLGGVWDNRDWAFSNRMALGNEQVRYLFWSTCFSLRVLGGHNPIRTWHNSNLGMRMIFGYETTSVDNPNYGKFFWEEWNKGKSFSQAFLDASWRISSGQAPSVCAMGATQQEAKDRLYNERIFNWGSVARNYYEWRWYYSRSVNAILKAAESKVEMPKDPKIAILGTLDVEAAVKRLSSALGYGKKAADNVEVDKNGNFYMNNKDMHLFVCKDGRFDAQLAKPNHDNEKQIDSNKAQKIAENLLSDHDLHQGVKLELDNIRYENACNGSTVGSGKIANPYVIGTTFEFRQVINGFKTVNEDAGVVRVSIDNDGQITHLHNSTREVVDLSNRPKSAPKATPKSPTDPTSRSVEDTSMDIEAAFAHELARFVHAGSNGNGNGNGGTRAVDSQPVVASIKQSEVGYDVSKNHGKLVARRTYELDMGSNCQKLYKVQVPLFD